MMSKDSERGQGAREPGPGDEANPAPLNRRVQADRQAQILDGRFPVGSQPPTVQELCEAFNASRMTVNRGLTQLERDGYISRQQGQRAFVIRCSPEPGATVAFELIREVGISSDQPHLVSRLGGFAYRPASAAIAGKLGLEKGEPVWRLERKQMAGAQAASASQHHIHLPEGATIPAGEIAKPLSTEDLYALLRIRFARMDLRLAAIQATPEQAKLLGIEEGDPLLSSEDLVYGQGAGHPPEAVVKELSVGERASLAVRVASKT